MYNNQTGGYVDSIVEYESDDNTEYVEYYRNKWDILMNDESGYADTGRGYIVVYLNSNFSDNKYKENTFFGRKKKGINTINNELLRNFIEYWRTNFEQKYKDAILSNDNHILFNRRLAHTLFFAPSGDTSSRLDNLDEIKSGTLDHDYRNDIKVKSIEEELSRYCLDDQPQLKTYYQNKYKLLYGEDDLDEYCVNGQFYEEGGNLRALKISKNDLMNDVDFLTTIDYINELENECNLIDRNDGNCKDVSINCKNKDGKDRSCILDKKIQDRIKSKSDDSNNYWRNKLDYRRKIYKENIDQMISDQSDCENLVNGNGVSIGEGTELGWNSQTGFKECHKKCSAAQLDNCSVTECNEFGTWSKSYNVCTPNCSHNYKYCNTKKECLDSNNYWLRNDYGESYCHNSSEHMDADIWI